MSIEHSPLRDVANGAGKHLGESKAPPSPDDFNYWHELINEKAAAAFLGVSARTLQGYRWKGEGPPFLALNARCIRYQRKKLLEWANEQTEA